MPSARSNGIKSSLSPAEELSVSEAAAQSSLLNKDPKASRTARCACGVDVDGMKETRDDIIRKIKEVGSPKTTGAHYENGDDEDNNAGTDVVLSSLYSCAALDLDDNGDDEPVPVSF